MLDANHPTRVWMRSWSLAAWVVALIAVAALLLFLGADFVRETIRSYVG